MKKPALTFGLLIFSFVVLNAQILRPYQKTSANTNTVIIANPGVQNVASSSIEKLPDLKFTSLNVIATPYVEAGIVKYRLDITYTVKNDGTAPIDTGEVIIQSFITTEQNLTKDLSFTQYFTPSGGGRLDGKGKLLAPSESSQMSYSTQGYILQKEPKPVYLILINPFGGPKEISTDNNRASMQILL